MRESSTLQRNGTVQVLVLVTSNNKYVLVPVRFAFEQKQDLIKKIKKNKQENEPVDFAH